MSNLLKQLEPIFFPVEKVEALYRESNGIAWDFAAQMNHWIVVKPKKGPKLVVNSCSANYHLITNRELITPLAERLDKEFQNVEARISQSRHARFYIDFVIKDKTLDIQKGDRLNPRVRLNNSYDGSVRYSFEFGFHRLVCTNGLTAYVASDKSFKLRHTSGVGASAVDKTMVAIESFLKESGKMVEGYKEMNKKKITYESALDKIEDIIDNTKYPIKKKEGAVARLDEERKQFPVTDWLIYNSLNYALYHDDSKMKIHKRDKVDAEVLKYISNS